MDRLEKYRQIIKKIMSTHNQIKPIHGDIKMSTIFDEKQDHYQLIRTGWQEERRIYGALIHISLEQNKIWIQYDGTEVGVANELLEEGVPREDIVLAYHSPFMRQYDGFAIA